MIKEHDQQAKAKATPKRLAYDDSEEGDSGGLGTKGLSERPSHESSSTTGAHGKVRSSRKSQRSLSHGKASSLPRTSERLQNRSNSREKTKGMAKSGGRRPEYQETSLDSKSEGDSENSRKDLRMPYKRPEPTPFTARITCFKYHRRAKLPRNIKVYEGNKDPEDHLSIFSAAAEQKEWPMLLTHQGCTSGVAYLGLHARSRASELAKKLNDEIPKAVDEMFERARAYIRGEAAVESAKIASSSQWDKGNTRTNWSGGQERV
ncbi:hypothetical protein Tco_0822033 [Tanacetum coccineum]|uniref:Reverse transcriptase domain-containing protein n=1 Tax=Tanacetum coccineum TaxID=301880 RepID=A0ABQ5AIS6_9ASTR